MRHTITTLLAIAVSAALTAGAHAAEPRDHAHHHHGAEDVEAFHDVLAPLWHAARGPDRLQNACRRVGAMVRAAEAIRSVDAADLRRHVGALKRTCDASSGDVERALSDVHDAFHRLIAPRAGR